MSWTVTAEELAEGAEEARRELSEYRDWDTLELLARALRWVDELAESRRVFGEAAMNMVESIAQHGLDAGDVCSRTAGYFALAGELEPARTWAARAVDHFLRLRDPQGATRLNESRRRDAALAVDTLYVCGESDRALALAGEHGVRNRAVELIEAERDGRVDAVDAVIGRLTKELVAERVPPYHAYAQYPVHPWDWLELSFEARARVAGEPVPNHLQMLERAGLLGSGASRRVARLEGGGVDRFAVTAAEGSPIEAAVDRSSANSVEITLDPRPRPHYLAIGFAWHDNHGYHVSLYTAPDSSPQIDLPYEGTDFREAIDATADWLDDDDIYGRDGRWAARTLIEITKDLPISEP